MAEQKLHAARKFICSNPAGPTVMLKLDFENAFNTGRDVLLKKVAEVFPKYFACVYSAYLKPSSLFCGNTTILSAHGLQQGDPLGPLLFCLVADELAKSLLSPLNVWYLDDETLAGDPDIVRATCLMILSRWPGKLRKSDWSLTSRSANCSFMVDRTANMN